MGMWDNDNRSGNGLIVTLDGIYNEGRFSLNKLMVYHIVIAWLNFSHLRLVKVFLIFSLNPSRAKVFYSVMIIQSLREIFVVMLKSTAR